MAGSFPFKYIAVVFLGNGLAGVGCNILRAITLVVFPVDQDAPNAEINGFDSALCFYAVGATFMVACALL
jgi:hypothetical protein